MEKEVGESLREREGESRRGGSSCDPSVNARATQLPPEHRTPRPADADRRPGSPAAAPAAFLPAAGSLRRSP
eukprot:223822-Hanusia_phi.AAC.1